MGKIVKIKDNKKIQFYPLTSASLVYYSGSTVKDKIELCEYNLSQIRAKITYTGDSISYVPTVSSFLASATKQMKANDGSKNFPITVAEAVYCENTGSNLQKRLDGIYTAITELNKLVSGATPVEPVEVLPYYDFRGFTDKYSEVSLYNASDMSFLSENTGGDSSANTYALSYNGALDGSVIKTTNEWSRLTGTTTISSTQAKNNPYAIVSRIFNNMADENSNIREIAYIQVKNATVESGYTTTGTSGCTITSLNPKNSANGTNCMLYSRVLIRMKSTDTQYTYPTAMLRAGWGTSSTDAAYQMKDSMVYADNDNEYSKVVFYRDGNTIGFTCDGIYFNQSAITLSQFPQMSSQTISSDFNILVGGANGGYKIGNAEDLHINVFKYSGSEIIPKFIRRMKFWNHSSDTMYINNGEVS